jgi:hypothetical protein
MPTVPGAIANRSQLAADISEAIRKLPKEEVAHVAYSLRNDSTDEPSIFFRVVLTDAASREDRLADVTGRVASVIFDSLRPIENWGLFPYFNFRSQKEQEKSNDPDWA